MSTEHSLRLRAIAVRKADMGDAGDLVLVVRHDVVPLTAAGRGGAHALLAEIDVAVEFADDHHVDLRSDLRPQRGGVGQFGEQLGRAQIGEQREFAAQAKDRLFGAQMALKAVAAGIAHRTEQDRVRTPREIERRRRQRMAALAVRGAADRGLFEGQAAACGIEHAYGFGDDFGTNPVSGQQCDQGQRYSPMPGTTERVWKRLGQKRWPSGRALPRDGALRNRPLEPRQQPLPRIERMAAPAMATEQVAVQPCPAGIERAQQLGPGGVARRQRSGDLRRIAQFAQHQRLIAHQRRRPAARRRGGADRVEQSLQRGVERWIGLCLGQRRRGQRTGPVDCRRRQRIGV